MQNFWIVTDAGELDDILCFKRFCDKRKFLLAERQLIHFSNWLSAVFIFGTSPIIPSHIRSFTHEGATPKAPLEK